MKLKEYLLKMRMEPHEFAYKTGISISSIYRYLRGHKMHRSKARIIEEKTEKKVTVEELLSVNESNQ